MIIQMPDQRKKKFPFGRVIATAILLLIIAVIVYCRVNGNLIGGLHIYEAAEQSISETASPDSGAPASSSEDYSVIYHDATYKQILDGFSDLQSTIHLFVPSDNDQISAVYSEVLFDHPEFFWENGGHISQRRFPFFTSTYIRVNYLCDPSELPAMVQQMDDVIEAVVRQADQYETAREKALFVHDYLVENCTYDEAVYNSHETESLSYTCYGCLVNHTAVCQGYAEAYKVILDRLGIPCGLIMGTAVNESESGSHAWNYVYLEDAYYMVDVTWDDPVGYSGPCRHDYFCITEEQMGLDHFPDTGWPLVKAQ